MPNSRSCGEAYPEAGFFFFIGTMLDRGFLVVSSYYIVFADFEF